MPYVLFSTIKMKNFIQVGTIFFTQDIPALAAEASKEHSNITYVVTAPLGLHELMVVCAH